MNYPFVLRLAAFASLAGAAALAGCAAPGTSVHYGQVVSDPGMQVSRTELYSGGTGVFSGGGVYAEEPTVYYDDYDEPRVIYGQPGTVGQPLVVQPPTVIAPAPIYVDPGPPWYPGYSNYPYAPVYGGYYYRGYRAAPPPRHVHPSRYHADRDRGRRGPGAGHPPPRPSSGIRQSPRPPAFGGGARPSPRPDVAPPRPPSGIRGGLGVTPPSRGYGRRDSGENSGP